ncbi:trehalase-like domain-containing protein [Bradyrhizobium sp. 138]|uniref:trehalase-like domain-containing protein n=1 Tax=Bradyrhizobium sp. 138 TaxID=2782615 RepID=UPI003208DDCD
MARIEDYALIGDCETAALVGLDSIDWLCLPRFDSDSCFARLLGSENNGFWRGAPVGSSSAERRYRLGTLILETTFRTVGGSVRVTDFMPPIASFGSSKDSVAGSRCGANWSRASTTASPCRG